MANTWIDDFPVISFISNIAPVDINYRHESVVSAFGKLPQVTDGVWELFDVADPVSGDQIMSLSFFLSYEAANSPTDPANAAQAATDASGHADTSKDWADLPQGTFVPASSGGNETSDYSGRHWGELSIAVSATIANATSTDSESLYSQSWIASNGGVSDISHIWASTIAEEFSFVSSGALGDAGNAIVKAGELELSGALLPTLFLPIANTADDTALIGGVAPAALMPPSDDRVATAKAALAEVTVNQGSIYEPATLFFDFAVLKASTVIKFNIFFRVEALNSGTNEIYIEAAPSGTSQGSTFTYSLDSISENDDATYNSTNLTEIDVTNTYANNLTSHTIEWTSFTAGSAHAITILISGSCAVDVAPTAARSLFRAEAISGDFKFSKAHITAQPI